jgi:ribosomal protein L35
MIRAKTAKAAAERSRTPVTGTGRMGDRENR